MTERAPLTLMTASERAAYAAWLLKLIARRRGSICEFYRNAVFGIQTNTPQP